MNPIARVLDQPPIVAVACATGQLTSAALDADADLLFVLNAGFYRGFHGVGTNASAMPFGNANDQTEQLLREFVLPRRPNVPVVAAIFPSDPCVPLTQRFERLKNLGVQGITLWPCLGMFDGQFREALELEEFSVADECAALAQARKAGFFTFGFAFNAEDGRRYAESGVDALVFGLGLTRVYEDIYERRDQVQHIIAELNSMVATAREVRPHLHCLAFGGPITTPEDLEQLFAYSTVDGFAGGSVFDRLPVENIINSTVRRFKSVATYHGQHKSDDESLGQMIGRSAPMTELFRMVKRIAPFDVNVCIEGESGTGKELIATQIHRLSKRAQQAFVTVNCGAIPDTLLESELFGHEKGAFTGADRRRLGKFELAHRGTLFLDEIADLSPRGQVALLRAIQQREITRVGGEKYIPVDVRILAASNQLLLPLVKKGVFRSDLYNRLNHIALLAPPLRERPGDIPLLVNDILSRLQVQLDRKIVGISAKFLQKLRRHQWTGNVRELQHVITRAAILEDSPVLEGYHFTPETDETSASGTPGRVMRETKRDACIAAVRKALLEHNGNRSLAAAALGVSRKTFYAWLKLAEAELQA